MRFGFPIAAIVLAGTSVLSCCAGAAQAAPQSVPDSVRSASRSSSGSGNNGISNAYVEACTHGGSVEIEQTYGGTDAIPASCAAAGVANAVQTVPFVRDGRLGASSISGHFVVSSFGARGIGTDDETAQVQAAITTACTASKQYPNFGMRIYFPPGTYPVHGLVQTCANVILEGSSSGASFLNYDGPQNSGKYPQAPDPSAVIISYTRGLVFGGLSHIGLYGFPTLQPVNGVATDLVLLEGQVDSAAVWDNVFFNTAVHDGIHLLFRNNWTQYINWFMYQVRFDSLGRYGIHADGMRPLDGNPLAIYGFSWTNPITHASATKWLYDNGYLASPWEMHKTPWGQGMIAFTGGSGYQVALYDGRLEGSEPQIPVGPGREGNLFVTEMPEQPSIALNLSGSSVTSVSVAGGGFGWTFSSLVGTRYTHCTVNPNIVWTVAESKITGGTVKSGGNCSRDATATVYPLTANFFSAQNVQGFQNDLYYVPLIYSASGRDNYDFRNVSIYRAMGNYLNGQTGQLLSPGYGAGWDHYVTSTNFGWTEEGHSFLSAPESKLAGTRQALRAGDIIYHDATDYASAPWGQIGAYRVVTYPAHGITFADSPANLCAASLTPSGNVWNGCSVADLRKARVSVDSALTFPSGGRSRASLDTYVTAVDWSTGAITTAAPGSNDSQVNFTAPQYRDSWSTGATYPASPSTIYYKGEVVYNSAPAGGRPIWWACSTANCVAGAGWIAGPAYSSASQVTSPAAAPAPSSAGQVFSGYCTGAFPSNGAAVSLLGLGAAVGGCASSAPEPEAAVLIPLPGSISNLFVRCNAPGLNARSGNFALWVNKSPTALKVNYGAAAAGTAVSDTADVVRVSSGDLLSVRADSQNGERLAGCNASFVYTP